MIVKDIEAAREALERAVSREPMMPPSPEEFLDAAERIEELKRWTRQLEAKHLVMRPASDK